MLLAMSFDRLGILKRLPLVYECSRMAECRWLRSTGIHAPLLHGTSSTEDSKSLPQRLSDRLGNADRSRLHSTPWS